MQRTLISLTILILLAALAAPAAALTRIRDIARPLGERENTLMGWGLVVGLKGTGDGGDVLITARPMLTLLQKLGNPPAGLEDLKSAKNVALVMITARLNRNGVRSGDRLDITVSSPGKAASLAGGMLLPAPLQSTNIKDDRVYAWAQGPVTIPDGLYPTHGVVKGGADVEYDFFNQFVSQDEIANRAFFDLVIDEAQANWRTADAVAMVIEDMNTVPGLDGGDEAQVVQRTSVVIDPRTVRIVIPPSQMKNYANYISRIMNLALEVPPPEATVVINEKAGTIAITANVSIAPCVVTVDGMAIRIVEPEPQPLPNQPLVKDSTWSRFDSGQKGSAQINDLIEALDQLNVPIQKKIDVIYALEKASALRARITRQE